MLAVFVVAGLKTANSVLERAVIPLIKGIKGNKSSKPLRMVDAGQFGTLAVTDDELIDLATKTAGPRRLHELAVRAGVVRKKKEET